MLVYPVNDASFCGCAHDDDLSLPGTPGPCMLSDGGKAKSIMHWQAVLQRHNASDFSWTNQ